MSSLICHAAQGDWFTNFLSMFPSNTKCEIAREGTPGVTESPEVTTPGVTEISEVSGPASSAPGDGPLSHNPKRQRSL